MKKVLFILLAAFMTSFYACGPSAEEKAQREKETQDSIAAAQNSANAAAQADSMQKAMEANKMKMDTTVKK